MREILDLQTVHVIPLNDLRRHNESGINCACAPSIQENGRLIVHNSFDGREFFEGDEQAEKGH